PAPAPSALRSRMAFTLDTTDKEAPSTVRDVEQLKRPKASFTTNQRGLILLSASLTYLLRKLTQFSRRWSATSSYDTISHPSSMVTDCTVSSSRASSRFRATSAT